MDRRKIDRAHNKNYLQYYAAKGDCIGINGCRLHRIKPKSTPTAAEQLYERTCEAPTDHVIQFNDFSPPPMAMQMQPQPQPQYQLLGRQYAHQEPCYEEQPRRKEMPKILAPKVHVELANPPPKKRRLTEEEVRQQYRDQYLRNLYK